VSRCRSGLTGFLRSMAAAKELGRFTALPFWLLLRPVL
jgi:hypothetical protein